MFKWCSIHEFWYHLFKKYTIHNLWQPQSLHLLQNSPKKIRQPPNLTMHACNDKIFTYAAYKSYCLMLCRFFYSFFSIWTSRRQFDWKYIFLLLFVSSINIFQLLTVSEKRNLKLSFKLNWNFFCIHIFLDILFPFWIWWKGWGGWMAILHELIDDGSL